MKRRHDFHEAEAIGRAVEQCTCERGVDHMTVFRMLRHVKGASGLRLRRMLDGTLMIYMAHRHGRAWLIA